jgi:hypothetical protein
MVLESPTWQEYLVSLLVVAGTIAMLWAIFSG